MPAPRGEIQPINFRLARPVHDAVKDVAASRYSTVQAMLREAVAYQLARPVDDVPDEPRGPRETRPRYDYLTLELHLNVWDQVKQSARIGDDARAADAGPWLRYAVSEWLAWCESKRLAFASRA